MRQETGAYQQKQESFWGAICHTRGSHGSYFLSKARSVYTANNYSGITEKTHVKTVKLNYSGLLYHLQVFAIHSTMQK